MRQLLPVPTDSADVSDEQLVALYSEGIPGDSTFLRLNFVSSLDGSGVGPEGRSGSINTPPDNRVFAMLRAWADVIVVGAGTTRAESYEPVQVDDRWAWVRGDRPRHTPLVVVGGSAELSPKLHPRDDSGEVVLATTVAADRSRIASARAVIGTNNVLQQGDSVVDLKALLQSLEGRGWRHILCEGGPTLAGYLVAADLVDELCLTWSPLAVGGDGTRILKSAQLSQDAELLTLLEEDSTVLGRWALT